MRALICGMAGFAGTYLAEHLLQSGDEVMGTSLRGTWPAGVARSVIDRAPIFAWDVRHPLPEQARRRIADFAPQAIYHLAAISVPSACGIDEPTEEARQVNVHGTAAVVELAGGLASRPRLLLASSCYVYAPVSPAQPTVHEDSPLGPQRGYGKSKLLAEHAVQAAAQAGRIDAVIARAFQHSGPRQSPQMILPDWASQLTAGGDEPLRIVCRDAYLDLSDVRDVVRAYRGLVVDGKSQTVYNVGSGVCQRSGDLLEQFFDVAKCRREIVELQPGRRQHPIADISRLMSHTNWKPIIPIKTTLKDILEYWQQRSESP